MLRRTNTNVRQPQYEPLDQGLSPFVSNTRDIDDSNEPALERLPTVQRYPFAMTYPRFGTLVCNLWSEYSQERMKDSQEKLKGSQESSAELGEAINSMYVFLSDVVVAGHQPSATLSPILNY